MKRKAPLMILTILILQVLLPVLTIIWESGFTIKSIAATTYETTVDGITWTYELQNNQAINVKPKDKNALPTEVIIPSTLDGYVVTSIGGIAFSRCSMLTSITIPSSVTSIGNDAFYGCNSLTSINVEEGNQNYSSIDGILFDKDKTTIIRYPSKKESTEYVIPNTVTNIDEEAFYYCETLKNITIPEGVTSIGNSAFYNCNSLTSIELPNSVTSIGNDAFYWCSGVTSIELPNGVTSIGNRAFSWCTSLTSIEISSGVTSIGNSAFYGCRSLTSINVEEGNQNYSSIDGILFNKDKTTIIQYPEKKEGTEYVIPNTVTSIGNSAFYNCNSLTSIEISNGVTSIGDNAFYGCTSLTSIELPNGTTSIGNSAFYNCSSLTSIEISRGVTSIGNSAFYNCNSLTSIELPNGVTSIGDSVFSYCSSLTSITIPSTVTSIGGNAFYKCYRLERIDVDVNNNNYSSKNGILFNKEGTTLITYPFSKEIEYKVHEGTEKIEDYSFSNVNNIKYIDIPNGVGVIGNIFKDGNTDFIKGIRIPDSVYSIDDSVFDEAENLTIYCNSGSYAENYAIENNISFEAWDNYNPDLEIVDIQFDDINFYNAIVNGAITANRINMSNYILNKNDSTLTIQMYKQNILDIKSLNIYNQNIQSIKGIENFQNLETIKANYNEITDITPISNLIKLKSIDFNFNRIKNISPLQNLKELETLWLGLNNEIENIQVLQYLTNLKSLDLTSNLISDISPLTNLINIEELYLGINNIKKINNLGNLTKIKVLVLSNNFIEDISELSKLTQLEELYLGGVTVMPNYNLTGILICGNNIEDISPLSNLNNLKILGIDYNHIKDISAIENLNLEELYIDHQDIYMPIQIEQNNSIEIDLPQIFIDAKDENSIAYTNKEFKFVNCELSENGTKIKIDPSKINGEISIQIDGGALDKTKLFLVEALKGDVNGDNEVNFSDILAINKHRLGKVELTGINLEVADVNGDNIVDFMDILKINKYRLGKINSL